MANYLKTMDKLKLTYIETKKQENKDNYSFTQYHYYSPVNFSAEEGVVFNHQIVAVKLAKTTILLIDPKTEIKVYLSDYDIARMIRDLNNEELKKHIVSSLQKVIAGKKLRILTFSIQEKTFKIKGIAFEPKFNDIICKNPADTEINGNDFIALINLILEKERTDTNPKKLVETARLYIGGN